MNKRILFVDDDTNVLAVYRRTFRKDYVTDAATGGEEALRLIDAHGPYAVIVSDMQMPGMHGIQLLAEVRRRAPDTVRIMLTGKSDLHVAIEAVNEGNIFRFLTKPCAPETMARVLQAGVAQHALLMAEHELLQKTLSGSVKVLSDVLAMVNPTAFGRASRVSRLVRQIAEALGVETDWQITVASMLSQVGCVTLPEGILEKASKGAPLAPPEWVLFQNHPIAGHDLIANIPRLDGVATIIKYQEKHFDGTGTPHDSRSGAAIPLGARMLKLALDLDTLTSAGLTIAAALAEIKGRLGWYDPTLVAAIGSRLDVGERYEVRELSPPELKPGMLFASDVVSSSGTLLVTKGQEVTSSLRLRLMNIAYNGALGDDVQVLVPDAAAPETLPAPEVS